MARAQPTEGKERSISTGEAVVIGFLLLTIVALLLATSITLRPWLEARELQQKRSEQLRELGRNWAKWQNQHIMHYRMTISSAGYGSPSISVTVEVKQNQLTSAVDTHEMPWWPDGAPMTIPALFSFAQGRIEEAPYMYVKYDAALGYPTTIYVDPWREPCCQDYWYTVQDLKVLP